MNLNIDFSLNEIKEFTEEDRIRRNFLKVELDNLRINSGSYADSKLKNEFDALTFKKQANKEKAYTEDDKFPEYDYQHNILARMNWAAYLEENRIS